MLDNIDRGNPSDSVKWPEYNNYIEAR